MKMKRGRNILRRVQNWSQGRKSHSVRSDSLEEGYDST